MTIPIQYGAMFEEDGFPVCANCGYELDWEDCWSCGGDGEIDVYDEDSLWYDPGDTERCDVCSGEGGWASCGYSRCPGKRVTT